MSIIKELSERFGDIAISEKTAIAAAPEKILPCDFCGCEISWRDVYGGEHCEICDPPPSENLVARRIVPEYLKRPFSFEPCCSLLAAWLPVAALASSEPRRPRCWTCGPPRPGAAIQGYLRASGGEHWEPVDERDFFKVIESERTIVTLLAKSNF